MLSAGGRRRGWKRLSKSFRRVRNIAGFGTEAGNLIKMENQWRERFSGGGRASKLKNPRG